MFQYWIPFGNTTAKFTLEKHAMIVEFLPYGDLLGFLRKSRAYFEKVQYTESEETPQRKYLNEHELLLFMQQIASGMNHLAKSNVSLFYQNI